MALGPLGLGLLASGTAREHISVALRPPVWGDLSVWPQETLPVDVAVSSRKWEGRAGLVQLACGLRGHRAHVHTQLCSPQPHPLLVSTRPRTERPGRGRLLENAFPGPAAWAGQMPPSSPNHPPTLDSKPKRCLPAQEAAFHPSLCAPWGAEGAPSPAITHPPARPPPELWLREGGPPKEAGSRSVPLDPSSRPH